MANDDLLPILGAAGQSPSAPGDPVLLAEGWERRAMVEPARIVEFTELYESLGFEVLAQKLTQANFGSTCAGCAESACLSYALIYTRKRA
jgi:hypothetical protein